MLRIVIALGLVLSTPKTCADALSARLNGPDLFNQFSEIPGVIYNTDNPSFIRCSPKIVYQSHDLPVKVICENSHIYLEWLFHYKLPDSYSASDESSESTDDVSKCINGFFDVGMVTKPGLYLLQPRSLPVPLTLTQGASTCEFTLAMTAENYLDLLLTHEEMFIEWFVGQEIAFPSSCEKFIPIPSTDYNMDLVSIAGKFFSEIKDSEAKGTRYPNFSILNTNTNDGSRNWQSDASQITECLSTPFFLDFSDSKFHSYLSTPSFCLQDTDVSKFVCSRIMECGHLHVGVYGDNFYGNQRSKLLMGSAFETESYHNILNVESIVDTYGTRQKSFYVAILQEE